MIKIEQGHKKVNISLKGEDGSNQWILIFNKYYFSPFN